jgi:hypothetical protein
MTESVYQKARRLLNAGTGWTAGTCDAVLAAIEAGEKAEANYQWMVEHAADNKLDGYRELASKCAELEERAEKAERERDEARTALDAISVPDTIALLKQRAEKAEARVRELEMLFKRMTLIKNVGGEGSTIAVIDFPAIEKVLGPGVLGPVPEPGQSTDVAELDVPREPVTTPAEPGPASVAEQEPAAEVSADGSGETGEHCP